jgi:hypothetical protein
MMGPLSLMMETTRRAGSRDLAPKLTRLSCVSRERTTPVAAPANATSGSDFEPSSSSWRANSRASYGGRKTARNNSKQKKPRSPNHSKKWTRQAVDEGWLVFRARLRSAAEEEARVSYCASRSSRSLAQELAGSLKNYRLAAATACLVKMPEAFTSVEPSGALRKSL